MELPLSDYTIFALETSCDETAAAIVRGGTEIIANVVASQIDEHRRYGGIVPEVASRQHILALPAVVEEALAQLPNGWDSIHAVAATYGPGLSGALLTGLNAAKGIAWGRDLPFIGVNHIEAHIYANWLGTQNTEQSAENTEHNAASIVRSPQFPLVALVVSGGHTMLVLLQGYGQYEVLGQTRDDAAGEAFDKVARIMGLGFPGGPAIQQAAAGTHGGMTLPRAWLRDSYDFSFSGLKTAVLHQVQGRQEREAKVSSKRQDASRQSTVASQQSPVLDRFTVQLAHAFQESVVDVLVTKAIDAAKKFGATEILLAGGVAANARLREEMARRASVPVRFPPVALCTDNAAMVAAAAYYRFGAGLQSAWDLDVKPNLRIA
ncbi:MAG TPA: tRNA (adenosine(37)-N6)-threonylcarbamoyltransferase complex transferase subunit TsaD [Roseiflexaceae bacterium]|jgi:N6-L-threonylcarbamoyladenine synthase|nr:tRNA (adenosine(37)-N6)-threonylcarbamoyltransferase complex transferase subunit TsaD [Roseiflexaceae bacterium]